jgi:hypothetical protein
LQLEKGYVATIELIKNLHELRKDDEYLAIQASLDSSLGNRVLLEECTKHGSFANDDGIIDPDANILSQMLGLTSSSYKAMKSLLCTSQYSQKKTDLTLSKLVLQIETSCLEQGRLLRHIRETYASDYINIVRSHSDLLWCLETAAVSLKGLRDNAKESLSRRENDEKMLQDKISDIEAKAEQQIMAAKTETQKVTEMYEERIAGMNKSMSSVQLILRNISNDTSQVRSGDMSQSLLKLNQLCEAQEKELEALRPIKEDYKRKDVTLMIRENELTAVRAENVQLKKEHEQRSKLLSALINKRKNGLTEDEYRLIQKDEDRAAKAESSDEEEEETYEEKTTQPPTSHLCIMCHNRLDKVINTKDGLIQGPAKLPAEAFRLMLPKIDIHQALHEAEEVKSVKYESDDDDDEEKKTEYVVEDEETKEEGKEKEKKKKNDDDSDEDEDEVMPDVDNPKTLQIKKMLNSKHCAAVTRDRALDDVWVVRVMRSIINAKMVEDSQLFNGAYAAESGLGCRRTRFPEFCHSWFVPPPEYIKEICVNERNVHKGISSASKAYKRAVQKDVDARKGLMKEADEQRWALYYGVKMLAQRSPPLPEATLFWNLLDETYPEDYSTFYFFALQTIKSIANITTQWGMTNNPSPPTTHYEFWNRTEGRDKDKFALEDGPEVGVITLLPRTMWIRHDDAIKCTKLVCSKAVAEDQEVVLRALGAVTVTAQGRMANIDTNKIKCVDLHMFMKMLCHTYRSDQVNRTSAIRLMFETAAAGRTAPGQLLFAMERGYGRKMKRGGAEGASSFFDASGGGNDSDDEFSAKAAPSLDVVQFRAVVETFTYPVVSDNEVSQMYREAHYASKGNVTYEEFIKVADRNQFFSRCCKFPSYLQCATTNHDKYGIHFRHRIGSLVHLSAHMMQSKFDEIEATLSHQARLLFTGARREVKETIDFFTHAGCIDGLAPLAAYRRLLMLCLHIRTVRAETDSAPVSLDPATVTSNAVLEIEAITNLIREYDPCKQRLKLETFKKSFNVNKMVEFWRRRVSMTNGPPLGAIKLMRCGYLSGKGEIRTRKVM